MFLFLVEYKFRRSNVHINAISPTHPTLARSLTSCSRLDCRTLSNAQFTNSLCFRELHSQTQQVLSPEEHLSLSLSLFFCATSSISCLYSMIISAYSVLLSPTLSLSLPLPHTYALHLRITFVDFGALFAGFTISIKAAQCVLWPD